MPQSPTADCAKTVAIAAPRSFHAHHHNKQPVQHNVQNGAGCHDDGGQVWPFIIADHQGQGGASQGCNAADDQDGQIICGQLVSVTGCTQKG